MTIPFDKHIVAALIASDRVRGVEPSGGFAYNLDLSVPWVATAIHAGHAVRQELLPLMALGEKGRLAEEDAATDRIIGCCPSRLWGLDSRAEYDLNRPPDQALPLTPEMFWGTRVYGSPPTAVMNRRSMEKYEAFFRFAASVIKILLDRFGACVVYDVHSYNVLRQVEKGHTSPPVFNLGTRGIDRIKWQPAVTEWLACLGRIAIPGRITTVAENQVFGGLGEFCRRLSRWDPNVLVLPTEVSKIYMDEVSGTLDDALTDALARHLAAAVADHGESFRRTFCR